MITTTLKINTTDEKKNTYFHFVMPPMIILMGWPRERLQLVASSPPSKQPIGLLGCLAVTVAMEIYTETIVRDVLELFPALSSKSPLKSFKSPGLRNALPSIIPGLPSVCSWSA